MPSIVSVSQIFNLNGVISVSSGFITFDMASHVVNITANNYLGAPSSIKADVVNFDGTPNVLPQGTLYWNCAVSHGQANFTSGSDFNLVLLNNPYFDLAPNMYHAVKLGAYQVK
jgi:hypothetical protein